MSDWGLSGLRFNSSQSGSAKYAPTRNDAVVVDAETRCDLVCNGGPRYVPASQWCVVRPCRPTRRVRIFFTEIESFPTITPHDLRHTAASLAVSAGANVKAVQRMLGHAKASMTWTCTPTFSMTIWTTLPTAWTQRSSRRAAVPTPLKVPSVRGYAPDR